MALLSDASSVVPADLSLVTTPNLIVLFFVGSLVVSGILVVIGGIYRKFRWYAYPWAVFTALPIAWMLKVFGILATPVSSGDSGGWQGLAKLFVLVALFPPVPPLVALLIRRPQIWKRGAIATGLVVLVCSLVAAHYAETRPISLAVHDVNGAPMSGWIVQQSVSTSYGRPAVTMKTTDSEGRVSFRAERWASVGFEIHRPIGNKPLPPYLEEWLWINLSVSQPRNETGTSISARWQTPFGAGQVKTYIYEWVTARLPGRPAALEIPVVTRRMDQSMHLGYRENWRQIWPDSKIEDDSLHSLVSLPEELSALPTPPVQDAETTGFLKQSAEGLRKLHEIFRSINYLPDEKSRLSAENRKFFDQIGLQSKLLCEYLTGSAPEEPGARLAALQAFIDLRAEQLIQSVIPWMKSGREAYGVLSEMRSLARPASKSFASIYPGADRDTQEALLRTFFELGPAPEDVLFALDEASGKSIYAFQSAMRSRRKSDSPGDWKVFENWLETNPGKLTSLQIESIREAFQERRAP